MRVIEHGKNLILNNNSTLVIYKNHKYYSFNEHRINSIINLLRKNTHYFNNTIVIDKVVGRVVASLLSISKAKHVHALTMSIGAIKIFESYHISYSYDKVVDYVLNNEHNDMCPMEKKFANENDLQRIYNYFLYNDLKVGILVGSFNPLTKAHIQIGKYLYDHQILDRIIYIPVRNKNKLNGNAIDIINMLKLGTMKYFYMDINIDYINNDFNYDKLNELKDNYTNMYIIIGSDNLTYIKYWDKMEEIMHNKFVIIKRNNDIIPVEFSKNLIIDLNLNISSTQARDNIKNKKSNRKILSSEIINYIEKNHLYK